MIISSSLTLVSTIKRTQKCTKNFPASLGILGFFYSNFIQIIAMEVLNKKDAFYLIIFFIHLLPNILIRDGASLSTS